MIANQANVVIDESHLLHVCNNGIDSENHKIGDTREGLPVFSPQLQELTHQHAPPRFSDEENLGDNLDESQLTIQDFNFSALSNMETEQSDLSPMIDHSLHPPLDNTEPSEMSRLMTSELRLASAQTDLEPGSATTASVAATMPVLMFTNQVDGRVGEAQLLHVCNNAVDTENQKIGETTEVSSKKSMPASPAPLEGLSHQHALDFGGENSGSVLDGSTFRSCQAINDLSLSTLSSVEPVQCDLSQNLVLPLPKVGDVQSSLDISDQQRCKRNGTRWRCKEKASPGKQLCEKHQSKLDIYNRKRRKFPERTRFSVNQCLPSDQRECRRTGTGWHCREMPLPGKLYCEKHQLKRDIYNEKRRKKPREIENKKEDLVVHQQSCMVVGELCTEPSPVPIQTSLPEVACPSQEELISTFEA